MCSSFRSKIYPVGWTKTSLIRPILFLKTTNSEIGFWSLIFTAYKALYFNEPTNKVLLSSLKSIVTLHKKSSSLREVKISVLSPSLAAGVYEDGDQIRLGHTLEFRSGGDITYRFRNNVRIGVGVFHISNAGLGYRNPGSEQLIFKYHIVLIKK